MSLAANVEVLVAAMNPEGLATRYGVTKFRDEILWRIASEVRRGGPQGVSRANVLKLIAAEHLLDALPEEETDE